MKFLFRNAGELKDDSASRIIHLRTWSQMHMTPTRPRPGFGLWLVPIMVLTAGLYWPGLSGPFLLDDEFSLRLVHVWLQGATSWQHMLFGGSAGTFGRPLAMASLAFDAWLNGYTPFAFKLGNLGIHLLCGALVYAIVGRLSKRDPQLTPYFSWIALGVTAAWLLHPLNVSTVLYAVQRMAQVSSLFVLGGLWLYLGLRARLESKYSALTYWCLFVAIPCATALGFLGKETALLLPALCLVLELTCFQATPRPRAIKWFFGLTFVVPTLGGLTYLIVRPTFSFSVYAARDFSLWERLLSQARALCNYLWKIVAPNPPTMGLYFDDFAVSTGLLTPPTTLLAILALLGISLAAWRLRTAVPALLTGWSLFLVGHAMESTILPLELYFEHRNYLPMVGVLYALAGVSVAAGVRLRLAGVSTRRIGIVAGAGLFAVLAFGVHGRARVWSSPEALSIAAVEARPESRRANMQLIKEALPQRDRATINAALERMLGSENERTRGYAYLNRVNINCLLDNAADPGDLDAAVATWPTRMTQPDWDLFNILFRNISNCRHADDLALANALDAIVDKATEQPDTLRFKFQLRYVIARFYARAGDWANALDQAALAWQPATEAAAAEILIRAQLALGNIAGAEQTWAEAKLRADPVNTYDTEGIARLRGWIDAARRAEPEATQEAAPSQPDTAE